MLQSMFHELRTAIHDDWTTLPLLVIVSMGSFVSILDFVFLQNLQFQVFAVAGLVMLLVGGYLRMLIRLDLIQKAGFRSIGATTRLQIVEDHQLVKTGLYQYIRHPLYLGETVRNFGLAVLFSSLLGACFMVVATIVILFRIGIEEKMLVEEFGEDYIVYQRNTKKLIPFLY